MIKKSVLITGASGDIGKQIAKIFAENGYDIIATYFHGNCDDLIDICRQYGSKLSTFKMDLADINSIENCIKFAFENSDYLDCAVFNAGLSLAEVLLCDESIDNINKLIDVNFRGTIFCNKIISKYFLKQKHGNIINISSFYGIYGGSCESVYSACKAGIIGLTKSLALEIGPYVRVNAVAPGFIDTKMTKFFTEDEKNSVINSTPLKRLGSSEDVASTVYYLASDKANFITGQVIEVTGGAVRF